MTSIDGKLISGKPLWVENVGYVSQPTLGEILEDYEKYETYVSTITLDISEYIKDISVDIDINAFDLLMSNEILSSKMFEAIAFFVKGRLSMSSEGIKTERGLINHFTFPSFRQAVERVACITQNSNSGKPKNKKALEILAKINKAKQMVKKKTDRNLELDNMIGALCARSNTYNLTNIMGLTLYQFYDQFSRQCLFESYDVMRRRWATWGKDQFDTQIWYKKNEK